MAIDKDWSPETQFGYELGRLVDRFLLMGIKIEVMCDTLKFAAQSEWEERQENLEAMMDARPDPNEQLITDYEDRRGT